MKCGWKWGRKDNEDEIIFLTSRNQEEVEICKEKIGDQRKRQEECQNSENHSRSVCVSIKDGLIELLLKLREVDELTERPIMKRVFQEYAEITPETSGADISSSQLLKMLQEALRVGLMASGQMTRDVEQTALEDQLDMKIPIQSPSSVAEGNLNTELNKRTPFPPCYVNLMANRGTGAVTASSPGQPAAIGKADLHKYCGNKLNVLSLQRVPTTRTCHRVSS